MGEGDVIFRGEMAVASPFPRFFAIVGTASGCRMKCGWKKAGKFGTGGKRQDASGEMTFLRRQRAE